MAVAVVVEMGTGMCLGMAMGMAVGVAMAVAMGMEAVVGFPDNAAC